MLLQKHIIVLELPFAVKATGKERNLDCNWKWLWCWRRCTLATVIDGTPSICIWCNIFGHLGSFGVQPLAPRLILTFSSLLSSTPR